MDANPASKPPETRTVHVVSDTKGEDGPRNVDTGRWSDRFGLSAALRAALHDDRPGQPWSVLAETVGTGWSDGGCQILAEAVHRWLGGQARLSSLADQEGHIVHVVARVGPYVIDGAGVSSEAELLHRWKVQERLVGTRLVDDLPDAQLGIRRHPAVSAKVAQVLSDLFPAQAVLTLLGTTESRAVFAVDQVVEASSQEATMPRYRFEEDDDRTFRAIDLRTGERREWLDFDDLMRHYDENLVQLQEAAKAALPPHEFDRWDEGLEDVDLAAAIRRQRIVKVDTIDHGRRLTRDAHGSPRGLLHEVSVPAEKPAPQGYEYMSEWRDGLLRQWKLWTREEPLQEVHPVMEATRLIGWVYTGKEPRPAGLPWSAAAYEDAKGRRGRVWAGPVAKVVEGMFFPSAQAAAGGLSRAWLESEGRWQLTAAELSRDAEARSVSSTVQVFAKEAGLDSQSVLSDDRWAAPGGPELPASGPEVGREDH